MSKQDLIDWHNDVWWPRYRKFIETPYRTEWGPGGKGESLTKVLALKPSKELREDMIRSLIAQTDHRNKLYKKLGSMKAYENHTSKLAKGGESIYKNRHSRTYLHNMGWIDEIPTLMEAVKKTDDKKRCYCGQEVHGPAFDYCTDHLPNLSLVR